MAKKSGTYCECRITDMLYVRYADKTDVVGTTCTRRGKGKVPAKKPRVKWEKKKEKEAAVSASVGARAAALS